jgi:rhamnosyltransferase
MLSNVHAVIVAYETNPNHLDRILAAVAKQCRFVLADNSNDERLARDIATCVKNHGGHYLSMGGNRGIGSAQNVAINVARRLGADAVLLLDDDSMPANDLIQSLINCSDSLGHAVVVGANALDSGGFEVSNARHISGPLPMCRDMMSSGTLIRLETFERVGPFDDSLFIDCVDFDWGWRAQRMGIALRLCRAAVITHRLGEGCIAGVNYPSPIRHYFQYRNILRMMTRSHTPWAWRLSQCLKLPAKLMLIPLLMPEKVLRLRFAFAGIRDAIRGRSGPWTGENARSAGGSGAV